MIKYKGILCGGFWTNIKYQRSTSVKALVWFWLIDETLSANLVYQSDYKIDSTTPSDEAMVKIMMMVMIKCLNLERKKEKNKRLKAKV